MLNRLHIENYTVISRVDVAFRSGLNVITGETGVGKSLLLDAVGSLVGEKRGGIPIRAGADRAIIEAEFVLTENEIICPWLRSQDLPAELPVIVRREFHQNGRNRYFINDTPVSLALARELGDLLLDLHGQHETAALFSRARQLALLDAFINQPALLNRYREIYRRIKTLQTESESLRQQIENTRSGMEVFRLQMQELEQLAPKINEISTIETELNLLENAEQIFQLCEQISDYLNEGAHSAVEQIDQALRLLPELHQFNTTLRSWEEELNNARTVLIELNRTLSEFGRNVSHDPHRTEDLRQRVMALYGFQKRWGYRERDLCEIQAEIEGKLSELTVLEQRAVKITEEIEVLHAELMGVGKTLSQERKQAATALCAQVQEKLKFINMELARFAVNFDPEQIENPYEDGFDRIEFTLSPDGKIAPQPLRQVASGGEMSRILLALKSALAEADSVETLIFDEIDQGISGRVARLVGLQLSELGRSHQVILVTHLPQIASLGDLHLSVRREGLEGAAVVHPLDGEDRVQELASLLTASGLSDGALLNAREMLQSAQNANYTL